jgi:hypothetical protein
MAKYLRVVEYVNTAVILAGGTITTLPTSASCVAFPWASRHGRFKCYFLAHLCSNLFGFFSICGLFCSIPAYLAAPFTAHGGNWYVLTGGAAYPLAALQLLVPFTMAAAA